MKDLSQKYLMFLHMIHILLLAPTRRDGEGIACIQTLVEIYVTITQSMPIYFIRLNYIAVLILALQLVCLILRGVGYGQ